MYLSVYRMFHRTHNRSHGRQIGRKEGAEQRMRSESFPCNRFQMSSMNPLFWGWFVRFPVCAFPSFVRNNFFYESDWETQVFFVQIDLGRHVYDNILDDNLANLERSYFIILLWLGVYSTTRTWARIHYPTAQTGPKFINICVAVLTGNILLHIIVGLCN